MTPGRIHGLGPETPPTSLVVWFLRGLLYAGCGLGVALWARGMREPGVPTPPLLIFLIAVGLLFVVGGLGLCAWAAAAAVVRRARSR